MSLARTKRRPPSALGWILTPLLFLSTALGMWIVLANPAGLFGWVVGGIASLALIWVLVSALFPARADRTCPACGRDTLVRVSEASTEGLLCKACAWRDETQSSFLLAEEEGALEPLLLAKRRRRLAEEGLHIRPWTGSAEATRSAAPARRGVPEPKER